MQKKSEKRAHHEKVYPAVEKGVLPCGETANLRLHLFLTQPFGYMFGTHGRRRTRYSSAPTISSLATDVKQVFFVCLEWRKTIKAKQKETAKSN